MSVVADTVAGAAGADAGAAGGEKPGAGAGADSGQGGGSGAASGGEAAPGQQPPARPDWMNGLSAEWQGNDRLAHYKSLDDLAKGFTETEAWARGRIALPKDGDDASFAEFAGKLRPESADGYVLPDADKGDPAMMDWFKGAAFDTGLHPTQAAKMATAWNQHMADLASQTEQAGKDALKAIELENPAGYQRAAIGIEAMLRKRGVLDGDNAQVLDMLEASIGPAKLFSFLHGLAEDTGELTKVDGDTVDLAMGRMTAEQANRRAQEMMASPTIGPKLKDPTTQEYKEFRALQARRAQAASGG